MIDLKQESAITRDLGAGANASSRADMVVITTNPISELVWSPHKGVYVGMELLNKSEGFPDSIGPARINEANPCKLNSETEVVGNTQTFISGPGDYLNMEDPESHLAHAEADTALKSGDCGYLRNAANLTNNNSMELQAKPSPYFMPDRDESPLKPPTTSRTIYGGQGTAAIDDVGDNTDIMASQKLQNFNSPGGQCALGGACLIKDKGKESTSLQEYDLRIGQVSQIAISSPLGPQLKMVKAKEQVMSDAEDSSHIAKERADSNESVESSNSKKLISTGKRACDFDPDASAGSKRHRKPSNDDCCSGSLRRQDSSFMNWISTMTNGFYRSNQTTGSIALCPEMSHKKSLNDSSVPKSLDKTKNFASSTMGFQSIFQSLYCASWRLHENTPEDVSHQRKADSQTQLVAGEEVSCANRSLHGDGIDAPIRDAVPITTIEVKNGFEDDQVADEPFARGTLTIVSDGGDVQLHTQVPMVNEGSKQNSFRVEGLASGRVNIAAIDSSISCEQQNSVMDGCNLNRIGLSNSSPENGPSVPSEGKATGMLTSVQSSKKSVFLESLWITRLSPKGSTSVFRSQQFNRTVDAPILRIINNSDNYHQLSSDGNRDIGSGGTQDYSVFPGDLCGSKRTDDDQKLTSKLNPILPSQRFIKTGPMASVFAKRLDAFKYIVPPKASTDANCATTTCFFCGKNGHSLRVCAELDEPELVDLAKNIKSYDYIKNTNKSSPLCMYCFELNHWAIACPHVLLKRRHTDESNAIVITENGERADKRGRYCCSKSRGRNMISWSGAKVEQGELVREHETGERRKSRMKGVLTEDAACTSMKPVEAGFQVQSSMGNPTSCSSGNLILKDNQIIPLCNIATAKVTDWPPDIFEMMKQLQLSRTVITRLAISPFFGCNLEGFFLRVRLGKWDRGLGGTGYHVARINGVSCENRLSVNIGSFHCMVDCRFVSNQDFLEDELKAWWETTMTNDGKPPLREDLNKKISERMKFGF